MLRIISLFLITIVANAQYTPAGAAFSTSGSGSYLHHRSLTIDHTQVGGATLTGTAIWKTIALGVSRVQNANCYDVIVTSDSGGTTKVPWATKSCDQAGGNVTLAFLPASMSSTVDTVLYVYYDNAAVTSPQNTGVLAPAYTFPGAVGIWPFGDGTTLSGTDFSASGATGTITAATATMGPFGGGAANFNGSSAKVVVGTFPGDLSSAADWTISAWIYPNFSSTDLNDRGVITAGDGPLLWLQWYGSHGTFQVAGNSGPGWCDWRFASQPVFAANTWHYLVFVHSASGNTGQWYWDGASAAVYTASAATLSAASQPLYIGAYGAGANYYAGALAEVEVLSAQKSADRILAEYNSQSPGSTMVTVGSEI